VTERFVDVRNVSLTYPGAGHDRPDVQALKNVSLHVPDGQRLGIIGANGAGKSSLLQVIAGVVHPTTGSTEVKGKVHAILSVGMGLRDEATGRENLFLDGAILGRSHAQIAARLDEMIDFAELGEFIDRPIRTYSSGMKARLGFASLITIDPEILIIDEALAVGDAFFVEKAYRTMKALTAKGAIVILVTHGLGTVIGGCDRCVWIDAGEIRLDGSPLDVTNAYRKSVQVREEKEIARMFSDSGASWRAGDELAVESAEVRARSDGSPRMLVEADEGAWLAVNVSGSAAGQPLRIRVWAERNDGLVLFDEQVDAPAGNLSGGSREIALDLGKLSWRPFLYQIHVELLGPAGAVAHNSTRIKVWSEHTITGGTPVLREPIGVRSWRV
jgi:lipopolysaccharide transport system ATP-binding protein